jgi:ATP-dependent Lhr-like helicase
MVERFREQLSTEKLADRLARALADAEAALAPAVPRLPGRARRRKA